MAELDGTDDYFDSRDVIQAIADLEAIRHCDRTEDEEYQLAELRAFAEKAEPMFPDWVHGETFIHEDSFEDYAKEFHEDINGGDSTSWPYSHIDWPEAALALQEDFEEIELHDATYWARH